MIDILVGVALLLASTRDASAQDLRIDSARDLALHGAIQAFLDGSATATELETELRAYAGAFEARPYKVRSALIDWEKVPQERLIAFIRITARITQPTLEAFLKGRMTPVEAARRTAPFFLLWPGYGMDPPDDTPSARARINELLDAVLMFSAPGSVFGHVAEGYTSEDRLHGVHTAPKMFLAPDNVCATASRAATLWSPQERIELRVGEPLPIDRLVVVARDETGAVIQRVPIRIEVEVFDPPLLNHFSNAMPENHLHPLMPGTFRIRARTICDDVPVSVEIPAIITH